MKITKYGKRFKINLPKIRRKGFIGIGMTKLLEKGLRKDGVLK